MNIVWRFIHKMGSPKYFYEFTGRWIPWLVMGLVLTLTYGLIGGLYLAPPDYQQGDGFRIIYVHVPSAFLSMAVYVYMAVCAAIGHIWKIKIADVITKVSAPIGASFTFLALVTGSIWGKPMWGTWWVWDARLTSELILLFLYFGFIAIQSAIPDRETAARAGGILVMVGVVNIPIIHYSVDWWNTLHQSSSFDGLTKSTIAPSMLYPLFSMIIAFFLFYFLVMFMRARCEVMEREQNSHWVNEMVKES